MVNKELEDAIVEKQGDLLYTTLAEECTELAQVCCKINRKKFLKQDFTEDLENFFEEICDVQINLQFIKQQVLKETGMTDVEYEQFIKSWTKLKEDKLTDIFVIRPETKMCENLIVSGYFTDEHEPIKCRFCGSKNLEIPMVFDDDIGHVEWEKRCKHCKKTLGIYSYGNWYIR